MLQAHVGASKHHGKIKLPIGKFSYLKEEEQLEQLSPIDLYLSIHPYLPIY